MAQVPKIAAAIIIIIIINSISPAFWPSGILGYLPNSFHQQLINLRDAVNLTPDPLRYSHWHLVPLKPDVFAEDQGSRVDYSHARTPTLKPERTEIEEVVSARKTD